MSSVTMTDLRLTGSLSIKETGVSAQSRATIVTQDANAIFPINLALLRVWDAFQTWM